MKFKYGKSSLTTYVFDDRLAYGQLKNLIKIQTVLVLKLCTCFFFFLSYVKVNEDKRNEYIKWKINKNLHAKQRNVRNIELVFELFYDIYCSVNYCTVESFRNKLETLQVAQKWHYSYLKLADETPLKAFYTWNNYQVQILSAIRSFSDKVSGTEPGR